jgi:hypothetical protein
LTLLRRPVEPEASEGASLASEFVFEFEPSEKSDESRWLERFAEIMARRRG